MTVFSKEFKTKLILLFIVTAFLFPSCKKENQNRIDLSDSIEYVETPQHYTVNKVSELTNFKPLKKENMHNINDLLENKSNYIWLKIDFTIPEELQNKDLGLFIAQLKTADRVWINGHHCGSYGRFPPDEFSAGFVAQHFNLDHSALNKTGNNTILIETWTGCTVSLSDFIFVGEELDAYKMGERRTFFSSKMILCFACVSFILFFIYLLLHFFMLKVSKNKTYLYYSLLMLFSTITLLPFCLYEIPWIKPHALSYFTVMKLLLTTGIYTTILFANLFIISYIGYKEKRLIIILRLILYAISVGISLSVPNNNNFSAYIIWSFSIIFLQFIITIAESIGLLKDKEKRKEIILLVASVIPALIGFIMDLISNNFSHIQFILPQASIYGWQFTSIIFIARLMVLFSKTYLKNAKLKNSMIKFNAKLEDEVELRTKELSEKNFILSRGLEAIALVQQEALPKKNKTFKGWDISVKYIPLDSEISGDLYDYYFTNSKLQGLSIIDISGHGIPAGLMAILAKGIISQQYLSGIEDSKSLTEILDNINQIYIKEKVNVENYFTGLLFNFEDFNKKDICKIQVANAGHPAPLLYSSKDKNVTEIKYKDSSKQYGFIGVDGLPVSFPTTEFSMAQNDILVCFTDGITEAMNSQHEEFSKKRVAKIIEESADLSASEIVEKIMKSVNNFIKENKFTDDITLIVLKRNNSKDYLEEI